MVTAVFFDFYGVLYPDTLWGLADIFIPDRSHEKKQALRDIVTRSDLGMITREQFWQEAADVYGVDVDTAMHEKQKLGDVDQQLLTVIKQLKDRGVKTGVISNVGVGFIDKALSQEEIELHFDAVVVSGEVGVTKPNERIFKVAAERIGVPIDECVFFDDVQRNVDGAIAAGMQSKLYEGLHECKEVLRKYDLLPNMDD